MGGENRTTGRGRVPLRRISGSAAFILLFMLLHGFAWAAAEHLRVHFMDVGQADSILVQSPGGENLLIDGGNEGDGGTVVSYLKSVGVKRLDYVVATHPHEDHIGGLDDVIRTFPVGSFYMPNKSHTTKSFSDLIEAVNASGAKRIMAKAGVSLPLKGVSGQFLAPGGSGYGNLNDFSAVIRITYGGTSFLFEGDAEGISEGEMLQGQAALLPSTVLKVGHHGSSSSSTPEFLKAVSPGIAVISVGKGNPYGLPRQETLDKLADIGATVYRTDISGTVVLITDGKGVSLAKGKPEPQVKGTGVIPVPGGKVETKPAATSKVTVCITKTGEKYHREGCRYLARSRIPITLDEAKGRGFTACKVCGPPE